MRKILTIKHHELMISYLMHRMSMLPRGKIEKYRGKDCIRLISDPRDLSVTRTNRKRIIIDSKKGQAYLPLVLEADRLELELQSLLNEWNNNYRLPPKIREYPPVKEHSSFLDTSLYMNSKENRNTIDHGQVFTEDGHCFRSKNEMLAASVIRERGYDFKTEIRLDLGKFNELYPDITFYIPEADKPVSLEIDGALDNDSYLSRSENRLKRYISSGMTEFRDVIFLRQKDPYSFDRRALEALIDAAILFNINEIL